MSAMVAMMDPKVTAESIAALGVKKAHLTPLRMGILSCLAGFYISIGCAVYMKLVTNDDGSKATSPQLFLGGIGFSGALYFILVAGAELFTGNCLLIIAALERRISVIEMIIDWLAVWWGNFLGSIIGCALLKGTGLFDDTLIGETACAVAAKKANLDPHHIYFRGIFANVLVCLAVIMAIASKTPSGKTIYMVMPIAIFVALGFEHCIANMSFFTLATILKCHLGEHGWYWLNLLLATAGNITGAAILATSYWATYVRETDDLAAAEVVAAQDEAQTRARNRSLTQMPVFDEDGFEKKDKQGSTEPCC